MNKNRWMAYYRKPVGRVQQVFRAVVFSIITWPKVAYLCWKHQGKVIFVYQPGKVGSKAIVEALKNSTIAKEYAIFHVHSLAAAPRAARWKKICQGSRPARRTWAESGWLSRRLYAGRLQPLVLTVVRNPFDTGPSAFLQNLERYSTAYRPFRDDPDSIDADALLASYSNDFDHGIRLNWYDMQIKSALGVDIIRDTPEIDSDGFLCFEGGRSKVAVLVYENLDTAFNAFCLKVFGVSVKLSPTNTTAEKGLSPILQLLRSSDNLNEQVQAQIRSSDLYRRFYETSLVEKQD